MKILPILFLLLTLSISCWSSTAPPKGYFDKVNELLEKQIAENNRLLEEGRSEEMNFVVDAYPLFYESDPVFIDARKGKYQFLTDQQGNDIRVRLNNFFKNSPERIKPYLVLIPAFPLKLLESEKLPDNVEEAELLNPSYQVNVDPNEPYTSVLLFTGTIQVLPKTGGISVTPLVNFDPSNSLLDFLIEKKGYGENEKTDLINDANVAIAKHIPGIQAKVDLVNNIVDDYLDYLSSDEQVLVTANEELSKERLKENLAKNVVEWQNQLSEQIEPNKGLMVKSYTDYQSTPFERGDHEYILNGNLLPKDNEYSKEQFLSAFNDQLHFLAEHSGAQLYVFPIHLEYLLINEDLEIDSNLEDGPETITVNPREYIKTKLQETINSHGDNIALVLMPYTNIKDGSIVVSGEGALSLKDYSIMYPSLLYTENDEHFENIDLYFKGELSNATEYQELVLGAFKGIKKPMITYAYAINSRLEVSKTTLGIDEEPVSGFTDMRKIILLKSSQLVDFKEHFESQQFLNIGEKLYAEERKSLVSSIFLEDETYMISNDYPTEYADGLSDAYVDYYIDALVKESFENCDEVKKLQSYISIDKEYIAPFELYDEILWPENLSLNNDIPTTALRNPKAFDLHEGNQIVDGLSYVGSGISTISGGLIPADEVVDVLAMGYYLKTGQTENFAYSSMAFVTPYVSTPILKKFPKLSSATPKTLGTSLGDDLDNWLIKQLPEGVVPSSGSKVTSLIKKDNNFEILYVKKTNSKLIYSKKKLSFDFTEEKVKRLLNDGVSPEEIKRLAIEEGIPLVLAYLSLTDAEEEEDIENVCSISRKLNWRIMDLQNTAKINQIVADICEDDELKITLQGDTSLVSEWDILYSNGSEIVRKDWSLLQIYDWLDLEVQTHIALMSDETINDFIDDLEYNGSYLNPLNKKIRAINGFEYNLAKAFTAYKEDVQVDLEYVRDVISHNYYEGDLVVYDWATEWYERSFKLVRLKENRENGKKFEENITNALKSNSSLVYQRLKEIVPDINERQILSQVQFCINNSMSCSDSGQYFIADLVLVKEGVNNRRQKIWDVIIADIKFKESSPFTKNQKASTRRDIRLRVKVQKTKDINDKTITFNIDDIIEKQFKINKTTDCHEYILKLYGDGLGSNESNLKSIVFDKPLKDGSIK